MPTLFNGLFEVPDPRPSKAHPKHRAARKALEEEHPHFGIKELGLKAGILALLASVALFPKIKAEAEILEGKVHDKGREKLNEGKDDLEGKEDKRDSRRRRSSGHDRDRRRKSVSGGVSGGAAAYEYEGREKDDRRKSRAYDKDLLYDRRRMIEGPAGRRSTGWDRDGEVYVGRNWGRGYEGSNSVRRNGDRRSR
jgi:hypothetical protein